MVATAYRTFAKIRSDYRKNIFCGFDCSDFDLKSGWNDLYDFGHRLLALAAFLFVGAALIPLVSISQTRVDFQLAENSRQIEILNKAYEQVPVKMALIDQKIALVDQRLGQMELKQREDSDGINQIRMAAFTGTFGLLCWLASQIFQFFGGRRKNQDG